MDYRYVRVAHAYSIVLDYFRELRWFGYRQSEKASVVATVSGT
jgi:hypothetical protein